MSVSTSAVSSVPSCLKLSSDFIGGRSHRHRILELYLRRGRLETTGMGAHIHQTSTSGEPSESTGHTGGEMCSTVRLQPRECVPMKDLALHPSSSI